MPGTINPESLKGFVALKSTRRKNWMGPAFTERAREHLARFCARFIGAVVCFCLLAACTSLPRNPMPLDEMADAQIPNFEDVRTVGLSWQAI
jgi:hypothetical protein